MVLSIEIIYAILTGIEIIGLVLIALHFFVKMKKELSRKITILGFGIFLVMNILQLPIEIYSGESYVFTILMICCFVIAIVFELFIRKD